MLISLARNSYSVFRASFWILKDALAVSTSFISFHLLVSLCEQLRTSTNENFVYSRQIHGTDCVWMEQEIRFLRGLVAGFLASWLELKSKEEIDFIFTHPVK